MIGKKLNQRTSCHFKFGAKKEKFCAQKVHFWQNVKFGKHWDYTTC